MKIKPWIYGIATGLTVCLLSGCHHHQEENTSMNQKQKNEKIAKQVDKSFKSTLQYYPTPNIETLINENMGNKLIINTNFAKKNNNDNDTPLVSEGMVLYINTSTRTGYGYYYINNYYTNPQKNKEKKYSVDYNKGIHLRKSTGNPTLDQKIKHFKFLCQYADFKTLTKQPLVNTSYNPNVPSFSAEYQLSNQDPLVKKLRHIYDIKGEKAPIIELKGTGNYGDSPAFGSMDTRDINIYFSKKPRQSIYSSIVYNDNWQEEEDIE